MMYELLAFLCLGAVIWRISPLACNMQYWTDILTGLITVYFWMAVFSLGFWAMLKAVQS